jgi:hypothetical protein
MAVPFKQKIMSLLFVMMSMMPLALSLTVNIIVLYDTVGDEADRTDISKLYPVWENYVNNKTTTDKTYPFNITVEAFETASNCSKVASVLETRLSSVTQPKITAIVAEGDNCESGKKKSVC